MAQLLRTHEMSIPKQGVVQFEPKFPNGERLIAMMTGDHVLELANRNNSTRLNGEHFRVLVAIAAKIAYVKRIHEALGHVSEYALCEGIKSGAFSELGITFDEVVSAKLSECRTCCKGKMVAGLNRSTVSKISASSGASIQVGDHIHVDIMILKCGDKSLAVFIAVGEASRYIWHWGVPSKGMEDLFHAVKALVVGFNKFRLSIDGNRALMYMHCDGEASIHALEQDGSLAGHGLKLVRLPRGINDSFVERAIRTVKDRVRSIIHGLDFALPSMLLKDVVDFAILGVNQTPKKSLKFGTPWGTVYRQKLEARRLAFGFGSIGYFHDPASKNGLPARAQLGMVIGRREEMSSGIKAYLLVNMIQATGGHLEKRSSHYLDRMMS